MKKTAQKLLSFIVSLIIIASCMVCTTYAEDNVNTINKIAFIDEGVEDYNTLVKIISEKMPVFVIENDSDGILQITDILNNYNNLDSIKIYSKGISGGIKLGTSFINTHNIDRYEEYIQSWSNSITPTADILLYACNTAKGDEGKQFINQISEITGADVAASTNYTGTYGNNTDWELEYCAGSIESNKDFDVHDMHKYKARFDGTTRTWDGEGEDNNWSTAQNWSGDVVPDAYDNVVFDSTSTKYVYCNDDITVYNFIIKDDYTGIISGNNVTVNNDFQMNGGSVNIGDKLKIKGTTNITSGESLEGQYLYTYGDVNITNVENPIEMHIHFCKGEGDTKTTIDGDFEVVNITFDEADHDYQINGNITISGNRNSGFTNNGNITINDGAKIDVSKCNYNYYNYSYDYYNNSTITENGTGIFYSDAIDLYFCDSNGNPIIDSSVGENIFISLTDFDANLDKDQKETVMVTVKRGTDLNDTVTLTLTETENNSSVFRNLTGLELVATDSTPLAGQLKYNGSENLIAEYVDISSPEDTISCKMDRDAIIWDGEGKNEYGDQINDWDYAENWSTNTVPKMYDIVLFNNTSVKDVQHSTNTREISKIVVDDGYTGEIIFDYYSSSNNTKVFNDIVVKDGTITLNSNLTVNGDVDIQGGTLNNFPYSSDKSVINGDLNVSGGQFKFLGYYLDLKGNLNISNGSFLIGEDEWSNSEVDFYGNADISGGTIDIKKARIKSDGNTVSINNIDGKIIDELIIEENTGLEGNIGVRTLTLNENKTLDINGTLTCNDSFTNNGTINVADGATLDIKSVTTYENNIINDNDTGKILYDAGGIGFVNKEGIPIATANIGDKIYVELVDSSKNKSIYEKESVMVTVSSQETSDTEVISLTETGNNTSVFRAETGLELIDTETEPVVGQLKYNGTEDLEAVYTDDRDENDTVSCNLYKDPIIWDGGGTDNNWTTPENWSTDTVPTRYDSITLNDTSTKNINIDNNIEMYKLIVEESYTGEITDDENASFYAVSDVIIEGGTINISGRFQTGGNLTVSGGSIDIQNYGYDKHNIIGGNLSVSDGEALTYGYFDINGNILISGGSFKPSYEGADTYIFAYGDVDLLIKTEIEKLYMHGNHLNCSTDKENLFSVLCINTDGNVNITGEIKTTNFNNNYTATTTLSGEGTIITLDDDGSFSNRKVLNIKDGAIFNASNYNYANNWNYFDNRGQIIETDGGKFYCDTKDMFFTNSDGNRIVFTNVGDEVFVKLIDGNFNLDGSIKEEVTITVESVTTGDKEDIILTETENYSGIFTNTSGLLLIADHLDPNVGQLKYNGTEDLQTTYTDSTDPNDVYTCNLFRDPLVWDGGGDNNYWNTAENWSEDRVPDEYDRLVFNGTSNKSSELSWGISKVYSITIEDAYQGVVKVDNTLNVEKNITVNGGKLEVGDNCSDVSIKANGDLQLSGGIIEDNSYNEDVFNDVIITGGEFNSYELRVKDNFEITGGKFNDNCGELIIEGDTILTNAEEFNCDRLNIYGNNINVSGNKFSAQSMYIYTDGEADLNGNINIVDYGSVYINTSSTLNLNGKIDFYEENSGRLENYGTLNINDNSILDLRKVYRFENSGTITISDTAKLYYDAEAMGVTDESGAPALDAFNFGENLIVSLIDKNRNLDTLAVENADVTLKNWTNGDEETYTLTETGNGTYEFRGLGFTTSSSDAATKGNNIFEGRDSDAFQIIYTDSMSDRIEYVVSKNCAELDIEGIDDLLVDGIDYGNGDINGDSSIFTITLQNRGDIPLGIEEISLDNTDDFSFSEEPDTSDIQPDSTRDININFMPTSCGEKTANLNIKTSDNDEGVITIPLKGAGVEPPVSTEIEDITVLQGTESYEINVFEIFEDAQDSDEDLEYSIITNSNSWLVNSTVIDEVYGTLTLGFNTYQYGDSYITLRATDTSNAYVDEDFNVTVSESHTISGTVVDSDGNAIEGAEVTIIDYYDKSKSYSGTTSADGTFSVSFPTNEINPPVKIRISKDSLKYAGECDEWGNANLGTITLAVETDEQKAQRLANDLTDKCLGLQNGDFEFSVTNNLLLSDTAGEGSTIEWTSSKPDVISDLGEVTRPARGNGDEEVIMTATVHVNDQSVQREFYVTVREIEANTISICMFDTHKMIEEREYQTPITINIKRTGDLEGTATVDYATVDDIAEAGSDYIQSTGTLTFLAGETDKTITLSINNDNLYEREELFKLVLSNPTGNIIIGESESEIDIMDDDSMPDYEVVGLCETRFGAMEGESAWIDLLRMNGTESTVTVDYTTQNNTAQSGSDFTAISGTLEFASGEDFKTISIDILDDNTYEGDESFKLILSNVTGGADIVIPKANIRIWDNDEPWMGPPCAPFLQSAVAGDEHVTLTWDTAPGSTGYIVYVSTTPGVYELPIATVDSSVNSYDITGLDNGTTYYFVVRATNEDGDSENSNEINAMPNKPSSGGNTKPTKPVDNGVDILVNGKKENAATSTTTKVEDKTVTTVTVDNKKIEEKLQNGGNNAVVTIPVNNDSDVVVGQLNGQTVKNMETKEAVLEIRTEDVTYTLPASQINIDSVSSEIGSQVELEDIAVDVKVSEPSQNTVEIVEDTANKNNYQIVVKPIEFEISCSSGNKTIKVSKFNAYVERIIAIPDSIDASKITTGIVLNPDGTFSHVPTTIMVIDGKYYAKINSLTNSAYSVIYSPKSFKDVESHWAKDSINDMGSRLVINGVSDGYYEPDRDITRAEFATIVVKTLGLMRTSTGKDVFDDVTKNEWYYDAVSIAYEYGIISGYGNGKFGPMDKITREQAMTIIARAMEITKLKIEFQDDEEDKLFAKFDDFKKSAEWAKDSIASCIKAEIVFGRNGKLIAPKDNITRAEVAVIVRRLLKNSKLI